MADIYPNVTGVVGSAQQKTCCYPIYLHAFDRVIAGGFPAKEASMKTIFPFGTEGGHQPPAWATVNMHDPIIVEFSLGKLSVGGERSAAGPCRVCLGSLLVLLFAVQLVHT